MCRRTLILLLCCLFFSFVLGASAGRRHGRRHGRRRGRRNAFHKGRQCLRLEQLLEKAYYAQVDLIRRGLPTRIIQSEFTFAINYFISISKAFKYRALKRTCAESKAWNKVFDTSHRAKFAIMYLRSIRALVKTITFLSFESYPKLPRLKSSKDELVRSMWLTCLARLEKRPRTRYKVSDFPFPSNVDILYDPERDKACKQFNKFSNNISRHKYDPDARSVLVALSVVSINLYRKGANVRSIAQMLAHFVGFVFNGIRCLRREGGDIKIPRDLLEAYSRNIAMIRSTTTEGSRRTEFVVRPEAVVRVFKQELRSLLSYACWGHLRYAELSKATSLPFKVNFLARLLGRTQYRMLLLYSKSTSLQKRSRSISGSVEEDKEYPAYIPSSDHFFNCSAGYMMMPRKEAVRNPMESCCNRICYRWSLLIPGYVTYSAEGCCARCNQLNNCDPGVTRRDLSDNNYFSFYIPKYGEQREIEMFLVAL